MSRLIVCCLGFVLGQMVMVALGCDVGNAMRLAYGMCIGAMVIESLHWMERKYDGRRS